MNHLYVLAIALMVIAMPSQAENEWELIREEDGVRIYSRNSDDSPFIRVKAVSNARGSLASFVALMNDVDNFKNWMHATKKSTLIERSGPYTYTYYMHSDLPWPARDRDVVLNLSIHQDEQTRAVYTQSTNLKGVKKKQEGIHRIESVKTSWRFVPKYDDRVKIVFTTKVMPNVQLPDWLADRVYHIGPYHTIQNMKDMVEKKKYRQASVNLNQLKAPEK